MSITYTWKLTRLRKASAGAVHDAVVQTHWTCTGTDADGNEGVFSGATPFNPADIDPFDFTDYDDLTEDDVLGWIKAVVVGTYWDHVEGQIAKQIEAQKATVEEVDEGHFPWAHPAAGGSA